MNMTAPLVKITAVRESQCLSAAERCERLRDPSERLSGIAESRRRRGSEAETNDFDQRWQIYRTIREGAVVLGESALELQRAKVRSKRGGTRQDTVTVRGVRCGLLLNSSEMYIERIATHHWITKRLNRALHGGSSTTPQILTQLPDTEIHLPVPVIETAVYRRMHGDSGLRSAPSLHEQGIHDRRWHVLLRRWKRNWDASLCAASVGGGGGIQRSDGHDAPGCTRSEPGWEWPAAERQEVS
ncbi:hypothetical protein DFP72DRAFT_931532 [Ephemerocybe angulata]|uniref:Uncharacterized protein n=1 Tax=Ephemerocybe angulata TaxID=980116 RepID=A0A8H6HBA4_9AGAR|nr:hypothetical protein DFP72DRAFT_931532 [Tulosesus angulatus]